MELSFEQWILTILSVLFAPAVIVFWLAVFLAAIGRSFGITKIYTRILLFIFEWGKERIRIHEESKDEDGEKTSADKQSESEDENQESLSDDKTIADKRSVTEMNHGFQLSDAMYFCRKGMQVIVKDTVTQRFDAAELPSWNLLTRTNTHYEFISWRLTFLWLIGCILRLMILFPFRAAMFTLSIVMVCIGTLILGMLPEGNFRRKCSSHLMLVCFRVLSRSFSAVIKYHNRENRAKPGGICVANHTSPIDIIILGCDNGYAMVGQEQGGFMGFLQRVLSRADHHIWFQRSETRDRMAVMNRLREHCSDKTKLPILIFPEGTCINNTSIMMFKKGSFEIGGTIYPVAIKYDSRFADAFWNSSKQTLLQHFLNILTSWSLVVDVWYLPPEVQRADETVMQFTNRVKANIARQGGLVDLEWDGQLKREKLKPSFLQEQQQKYSRHITGFGLVDFCKED